MATLDFQWGNDFAVTVTHGQPPGPVTAEMVAARYERIMRAEAELLYHYFVTILGFRPGGLGFQTIDIAPQLGPLARAGGRLIHPRGEIVVDLSVEDGKLHGSVSLPEGTTGILRWADQIHPLGEGKHQLERVFQL